MFKSAHSDRYKKLTNALIKIRKDAGLTQVQLADKLSVPQQFISKYETGERNLDFVEVSLVCAACGVKIEALKI